MVTIDDFLPENNEERAYTINNCPIYKRLKDYYEDEHMLDFLVRDQKKVDEMLIYATGLYDYTCTKFCTNPANRDFLYAADELSMKEAIDYIDEKANEPYDSDDDDQPSKEIEYALSIIEKYDGLNDPDFDLIQAISIDIQDK